jgi:hypothetical protein
MDVVLEALNRAPSEMTDRDLDEIIGFLRKSKAAYDRGEKPKKEGSDVDLVKALGIKPLATVTRRV